MKQFVLDWKRLLVLRIIVLSSVNEVHNKMEMHNQSNLIHIWPEDLRNQLF